MGLALRSSYTTFSALLLVENVVKLILRGKRLSPRQPFWSIIDPCPNLSDENYFSVPDLSELVIGYVTCPSETIATEIATAAINSRLAACANILPFMISIYEWENNVRSENEGK